MDLGPHAFYIAGSYAVTAVIVAALILRAILDHRAQTSALADFNARGVARRSESGRGSAGSQREPHSRSSRPAILDPGQG